MKVFVAGPFTSAIASKSFDVDLRKKLTCVHSVFDEYGHKVLSSHRDEDWGSIIDEESMVERDTRWLADCDIFVGVLPLRSNGEPWRSDGTFIEIGIAVSLGKPVFLLIESPKCSLWSYFLRNIKEANFVLKIIDLNVFINNPAETASMIVTQSHFFESKGASETIQKHVGLSKKSRFSILGKEFVSLPSVFSPKYSQSGRLLVEELGIKKGDRVLDIGCGTGILGLGALLGGASSVTFIDVNPHAVENARLNANLVSHGASVEFFIGDGLYVLDPIHKFDLFLFNPPYWNRVAGSMLERAFYDDGYRFLRNTIRGLAKYALSGARLEMIFSDQGDFGLVVSLLHANFWDVQSIEVKRGLSISHHIRFVIKARFRGLNHPVQ